MPSPADVVTADRLGAALAAFALATESPTGDCRVVAIDGWSGSGKTSLAERLALSLGVPCLHLDDWVPGWSGLAGSVRLLVEWVLEPLAGGEPAGWRRWDWDRSAFGPWQAVAATKLLVVEGCGATSPSTRPWLSAAIWLSAGEEERARRLRARPDWPTYAPWAEMWADQERAQRAGDDPVLSADVVVESGHDGDTLPADTLLAVRWNRRGPAPGATPTR